MQRPAMSHSLLTSHIIHLTSSITHHTSNPSPYLIVSLHISRLVKGFVAQQSLLYYNKKKTGQTLPNIGGERLRTK